MSAAVALLLIWDNLTSSTDSVYETSTSALSWFVSLPDQQTTSFDNDLMLNELISLLPYILFIYVMGVLPLLLYFALV
jgi:hypothetical protein